ncbi:MAG: mechanosensitive ion channel [Rhodocyclaceae bacterium]|nr:mechanosensitive ion channel [Rhodocyclaceae bacterium]MCB1962720.1 mechanosensitive ion channel [Rhodocyclaceae bacterium]
MNVNAFLIENQWLVRLALSVLLLAVFVAGRRMVTLRLRGQTDVLDADRRRRVFYARTAFNAALAGGMVLIWLGHLQNVLFSLTAVTVAVVVATKELLMCISGFVLRTGASSFSVGDWIEVNGIRGEVSDYNLLTTTLLEITPPRRGHAYTGNVVVIPNSLFLSHPVRGERLSEHFVQHPFVVSVDAGADAEAAAGWLQQRAEAACADFAAQAERVSARVKRTLTVDVHGPAPAVSVATSDNAKIAFQVQLFCPAKQAATLETQLTRAFLSAVAAGKFGPATVD